MMQENLKEWKDVNMTNTDPYRTNEPSLRELENQIDLLRRVIDHRIPMKEDSPLQSFKSRVEEMRKTHFSFFLFEFFIRVVTPIACFILMAVSYVSYVNSEAAVAREQLRPLMVQECTTACNAMGANYVIYQNSGNELSACSCATPDHILFEIRSGFSGTPEILAEHE